ncbi:MAG: hypothetical protein K2V38_07305, partial [Gemmataceae bacterium]|nr:hypothetical protein [Gemmataceae bacterium]
APAQPAFPQAPSLPTLPQQPGALPPTIGQPVGGAAKSGLSTTTLGAGPAPGVESVPLPHPENKTAVNSADVVVRRMTTGWEVRAGSKTLRNTGENETTANSVARVFRELQPTEWVVIGNGKPVVEYGLTNGRPAVTGTAPPDPKNGPPGYAIGSNAPTVGTTAANHVVPIDLRTTRAEAVRGVWVVRDDNNILLNFGTDKAGAEQAGAVIQRYGFNRVGTVGSPAQPALSYLFVSAEQAKPEFGRSMVEAQINALTRTGIPLPGVGFTGEMVKIDHRKVEARKDGAEWVVAAGTEVLGRFGPTEWAAREAVRTVQDMKFTEFCKLGGQSNLTFFLVNGKAPGRAPLSAQGKNFSTSDLKVQQVNDKWLVTDAGKQLFEVGSPQEGETVVRVLKSYGFDQTAHLSAGGSKGGITFLVKNR